MTGTTRVDFYQLSRDPVDVTVAKLARKVLQAGERLVVVSAEAAQREHLSKILWEQGGAAFPRQRHGRQRRSRQPILLVGCMRAERARAWRADRQTGNGARRRSVSIACCCCSMARSEMRPRTCGAASRRTKPSTTGSTSRTKTAPGARAADGTHGGSWVDRMMNRRPAPPPVSPHSLPPRSRSVLAAPTAAARTRKMAPKRADPTRPPRAKPARNIPETTGPPPRCARARDRPAGRLHRSIPRRA